MKSGFSLKALFPRYDGKKFLWYRVWEEDIILSVFSIFFCIVGLVGNGNIIRLLGFHIERKPFAIYVLNLAVADFGALLFLPPLYICVNIVYFFEDNECPVDLIRLLLSLFLIMYSSHQLLLAAIGIDRWVSVLFPNWHQCHQSPLLSSIICAVIWAVPFALYGVLLILFSVDLMHDYAPAFLKVHVVATLICLLPVTISTLTLSIKVCLKSQPCQCGNLSKVILLIFFSSLLLTILEYTFFIMFPEAAESYYGLWASLKISINPLIYFLAGRQNGGKFQQRMTVILQRVFKEERNTRMEWPPRTQTSHL